MTCQPDENETEARALVANFFKEEPWKIDLWWSLPNPGLGQVPPEVMLKTHGSERVLKIIKSWLEGNIP